MTHTAYTHMKSYQGQTGAADPAQLFRTVCGPWYIAHNCDVTAQWRAIRFGLGWFCTTLIVGKGRLILATVSLVATQPLNHNVIGCVTPDIGHGKRPGIWPSACEISLKGRGWKGSIGVPECFYGGGAFAYRRPRLE